MSSFSLEVGPDLCLKEGILRGVEWLYGHYVDHVVYGMLQDEWKERLWNLSISSH